MLVSPQKSTIVRPVVEVDGTHVVETVFAGLSPYSRYLRFHTAVRVLSPGLRAGLLPIDGRRRAAVAAWVDGQPIGIARIVPDGRGGADVAVAVVDAWQRRGIGRRLLAAVADLAVELGCSHLDGMVMPENEAMLGLVRHLYPLAYQRWTGDTVELTIPIGPLADEVTDEQILRQLTFR